MLVASAVLETGQFAAVTAADWSYAGAILYMTFGASIGGYGLWYHLVGRYAVSRIVAITLLAPVIGVASGIVLLGEAATWQILVGGLMTISGVAVVQLRWARPADPSG